MWKCKICGCENTDSNATCRMCKTPAPSEVYVAVKATGTDLWKCKICGCENPNSRAVCRICMEPAPGEVNISVKVAGIDLWKCKICGCENPNSNATCRICKAPAPDEVMTTVSSRRTDKWKCKICGCENPNSSAICRICKAPAPDEAITTVNSRRTDKWKCKICGCENPNSKSICRMCKAPAPREAYISDVSDGRELSEKPLSNLVQKGIKLAVASAAVVLMVMLTGSFLNVFRFPVNTLGQNETEAQRIGVIKPLDESTVIFDPETEVSVVNNQILITFKIDVSRDVVDAKIAKYNGVIVGYLNGFNDYQVEIKSNPPLGTLKSYIKELNEDKDIVSATLNSVYDIQGLPNDPWDGSDLSWNSVYPDGCNWGITAIDTLKAWALMNYSIYDGAKIGIIDSGFDIEHEDLKIPIENTGSCDSEYLANEKGNLSALQNQLDNNHGTIIAGIIGAISDNGKGITGVINRKKDDRSLYIYKYDKSFAGMKYALLWNIKENGVKIINFSQGNKRDIEGQRESIEALLNALIKAGYDFLIIQAAGNDGKDASTVGGFNAVESSDLRSHILVVGAAQNEVDDNVHIGYNLWENSNFGVSVDVVAPGVDIYSTLPNNKYGESTFLVYGNSGTSFAAPFVTATAGLISSANPNLSCSEIRQIIIDTAEPAFEYNGIIYNMVNAAAAVEKAVEYKVSAEMTVDQTQEQQNSVEVPTAIPNSIQTPSNNIAEETHPDVKKPRTGSPVNIEENSIYYDNEYVSVQISYPEISGLLDKELEKEINTVVMQEMYNDIDTSEQVAVDENSDYLYSVEASYEVGRNDGAFLSMYLNVYCESGGAHGEEYTLYYNVLNTNPGVILSLSDLFIEGSDYVSVLNEKIRELIEKDSNLSQENYFTTISEDQDFYLTDSELVVTFQKGDIAAYIEDQPVFRVPLNEISGMVVPWLK